MKTGTCSYAVNCKFDHPPPGEVMALAGPETSTKAEEEGPEIEENVGTENEEIVGTKNEENVASAEE